MPLMSYEEAMRAALAAAKATFPTDGIMHVKEPAQPPTCTVTVKMGAHLITANIPEEKARELIKQIADMV